MIPPVPMAYRLAWFLLPGMLCAGGVATLPPAEPLPVVDPVIFPAQPTRPLPIVDIPSPWRVKNWAPYGYGSCVHASMVMILHWQGQHALAESWRQSYHSGETFEGLAHKFEARGVRWAGVTNGDVAFLEWAIRTRRGCGVTVMGGRHMVLLVHLDSARAGILDNNSPGKIRFQSRESFLMEWRNAHGWAVTPVYDPPTPAPWQPHPLSPLSP